jgi:hypothetical protein
MRTYSHTIILLAASALLAGCVSMAENMEEGLQDSMGSISGDDMDQRTIENEFRDVSRNCQLPGANLSWAANGSATLNLPADVSAARDRPPASTRIACITHWAHERGLRLTVADAR